MKPSEPQASLLRGAFCEPPAPEAALLGALLRDPRRLDDVQQIVRGDYFRDAAHLALWNALADLRGRGEPIDLVTAGRELTRGPGDCSLSYLVELWEQQATGANALYYARLVRNDGLRRLLGYTAVALAQAAAQPGDADELLAEAEREIFTLAERGVDLQTYQLETLVNEAFARADLRAGGDGHGITGLPTGYTELDELLSGLQPSELTILAARPSLGKTSLILNIIANTASVGIPSFFASIEQSRSELTDRMICSAGRVNSQKIRNGTASAGELADFHEAGVRLRKAAGVSIDDASQQNVLRIAANARRLKARGQLGFVAVDYLQLIHHDDPRAPRHEQVGASARRLKALARELSVPVLCLAQLNRQLETRTDQRPRLADLRESGEIEQHADNVLFLHRPDAGDQHLLEVIVAKQRNGPVGSVPLTFVREYVRFENAAVGYKFDA